MIVEPNTGGKTRSATPLKLAIIADTHLPRGARRLAPRCTAQLRAADLIVHAGDFTRLSVLEELQTFGRVLAVYGNVDEPGLRSRLPERAEIELAEDVRLAVVHDAGPARGRLERLRRRFPRARAVVFGHSHIPLHQAAPDGFQIFNPGSPTDRRRSPRHTMGLATLEPGGLRFRTVALD
jgi:putative phosphoesterase